MTDSLPVAYYSPAADLALLIALTGSEKEALGVLKMFGGRTTPSGHAEYLQWVKDRISEYREAQ